MSFLVVENLDESDQLILGQDFVRNFDVTIDLKDVLIRIKDQERKYEKKPINKMLINQAKVPIFLDRKVRLKPNQAVIATFIMRILHELINDRQVCLAHNDLNLIKSYLIPYLIRDKEQETSVIKKANDFISFKFGDVQFLDIMKFLGGATTLDSFLKAYKASETKGFFPYEWFDNPDKLDFPGLPPYEAFFSKLRNNNPLDKDFTDYEKLRKSGLDEQQALKKLQIKTVPSSGLDNYNYLQETWKKNGMTVFKDFLKWYNNKQ